jgi:hypothetical protein
VRHRKNCNQSACFLCLNLVVPELYCHGEKGVGRNEPNLYVSEIELTVVCSLFTEEINLKNRFFELWNKETENCVLLNYVIGCQVHTASIVEE